MTQKAEDHPCNQQIQTARRIFSLAFSEVFAVDDYMRSDDGKKEKLRANPAYSTVKDGLQAWKTRTEANAETPIRSRPEHYYRGVGQAIEGMLAQFFLDDYEAATFKENDGGALLARQYLQKIASYDKKRDWAAEKRTMKKAELTAMTDIVAHLLDVSQEYTQALQEIKWRERPRS